MRNILALAALACLLAAAAPAHADEEVQVGKDAFMSVGMKFWVNSWQTNLTGNSGKNWTMLTEGPQLGYIPNLSFKYKQLLLAGSFMATSDYKFPQESFYNAAGTLYTLNVKGTRQEADFNLGFYVHPSVALTMGYKGITEKFTVVNSISGTSTNSVYLNGVTFGIAGSAPIGSGWSVYGSGAGGPMFVTYTPASTYTDSAIYEASELGLAYRPIPNLSLTGGYKFQLIQTKINSLNSTAYSALPRNEVTRGFMLGANFVF